MTTTITLNPAFKLLNGVQQNRFSYFKAPDTNMKEGYFDVTVDSGDFYPGEGIQLDFSSFGFNQIYAADIIQQDFSTFRVIANVDETNDFDPSNVRARLVEAGGVEIEGEIQNITISDGGSGYTDTESLTITGDTSGANNATGTANTVDGALAALSLGGATGTNYKNGETVTLVGLTSSANNATGVISTKSGSITNLTITDVGSGYTNGETVDVIGDKSGSDDAEGTATTVNGYLSSVTITAPGSGYTNGESLTLLGGTSGSDNAVAVGEDDLENDAKFSIKVIGN